MHVKTHWISLFPIKRLQKLKTGNNPLNKIITLKRITSIPEPWWCTWATSSIAEEDKMSLPTFYFLPAWSRELPLSEYRVIRKNTSQGSGDALGIISSAITSCLCKFWLCIIQDRWNSTHFYEYFDVFWWIHLEPKFLMSGRFFTLVLFCPKALCAIICEDIFMAWTAHKLLPYQFSSHAV